LEKILEEDAARERAPEENPQSAIWSSEASISVTGSEEKIYALLNDLAESYPALGLRSFQVTEHTYMDVSMNPIRELQANFVLAVYMCEK